MPGYYEVKDRSERPSRGGLVLPLPPTRGPIKLVGGIAGLRYRFMGQPFRGAVQTAGCEGIWTDSISDCVVLAALEWSAEEGNWTNFCFEHLKGGLHQSFVDIFRRQIGSAANSWALIAARDWVGTDTLKGYLVELGIPVHHITTYVSRRDFKFGLRFFGAYFGEV